MLHLRFDNKSSWKLRWPRKDIAIIRLGELYVAHEGALPPEEQLATPSLTMMQATLTVAQTAVANANAGEEARAIASELFRQKMDTVKTHLKHAVKQLKLLHRQNLAELETWGIETVYGQGGILVRLPNRQADWLTFLNKYVAQESSLPPETQLHYPPLAEMTALRDEVQSQFQSRAQGKLQRKNAVAARKEAAARLYDLLQLAAGALVVVTFEGHLTPALGAWGYEVVQIASPPPEPAADSTTMMSMS